MASLTVTAKPAAFVVVALDWSSDAAVTEATISRVLPDGTATPVRGGDAKSLLGGKGVVYDTELPLDTSVTWQATSPQTATVLTSTAVTIPGGRSWRLRHPLKPALDLWLDHMEYTEPMQRDPAVGIFEVHDRADPVVITAARKTPSSTVRFRTDTAAQEAAVDAILDDGCVLQLASPAGRGWGTRYVAVMQTSNARLAPIATMPHRRWTLPVRVVGSPTGIAQGPVGYRWSDIKARYAGWTAVKAAYATWYDLLVTGA